MKILSILTMPVTAGSAPMTQEEMDPGSAQQESMRAFVEEMRSNGVLIDTGGRAPNMLELIVARKNGKSTITDGPFTEAKEVVGGFALMEVKDRDDAIAQTNRFLDLIGTGTCHLHEVGDSP